MHVRYIKSFVSVLCVAALGTVTMELDAYARKPNKEAMRLEKLARKAYKRKEWNEAAATFEAAYATDPIPKFLYNAGRSHERKGDVLKAIALFERFVKTSSDTKDRDDAEDRLRVLTVKRLSSHNQVNVSARPDGTKVVLKGSSDDYRSTNTLSEWVPFGTYELTASNKGYMPHKRTVEVNAGEPTEIAVTLQKKLETAPKPKVAAVPKPVKPKPETKKPEESTTQMPKNDSSMVPWIIAGTGGVLLIVGVVFGLQATSANDELDGLKNQNSVKLTDIEEKKNSASTNAMVANVLYGCGAVAVAAGAVLMFIDFGEEKKPAKTAIFPFASHDSAGVAIGGTF